MNRLTGEGGAGDGAADSDLGPVPEDAVPETASFAVAEYPLESGTALTLDAGDSELRRRNASVVEFRRGGRVGGERIAKRESVALVSANDYNAAGSAAGSQTGVAGVKWAGPGRASVGGVASESESGEGGHGQTGGAAAARRRRSSITAVDPSGGSAVTLGPWADQKRTSVVFTANFHNAHGQKETRRMDFFVPKLEPGLFDVPVPALSPKKWGTAHEENRASVLNTRDKNMMAIVNGHADLAFTANATYYSGGNVVFKAMKHIGS